MEKLYGHKIFGPVLFAELTGTCLLMLACNLAGDENLLVPLAYFALVTCFYEVSGGHFNPAVSIGVWISEKRYVHNLLFLISISLFQFLGALLALCIGYIMRVTVTDPETGG